MKATNFLNVSFWGLFNLPLSVRGIWLRGGNELEGIMSYEGVLKK